VIKEGLRVPQDAGLELTPQAAAGRHWGTLWAMVLARIAFGYQIQTVASLGPDLRAAFGIEFATLGTLMGLMQLPGIVACIPSGFLARRFGDRNIIALGMVAMVIGSLGSSMAAGPVGIGLGRVVAGFGAVALTVLQPKAVADRFTGANFNIAMGILVGAFPIGIGFGQLTHARLAEAYGWPAAFVAGAGVAAVALLVLMATWRDVAGLLSRAMNWPSRHEIILVLIAGAIWTTFNAGYFNFLGYLPSVIRDRGHPTWVADVAIAMATWGNLPMMLLGGVAAARIGAVPVFIAGMLMEVLAVSGLAWTDWPLLWGLVFGTFGAMQAGIIVGWGTMSVKPENRAVGMGIFYTTYYIGGAGIPALCGRAADLIGDASGAFWCASALTALSLPFWWLHRRLSR
jgi:predicted MFS family arabinose efflux permease